MLIFGEFFKTQSDQNIHQNAPNCTIFSKSSRVCINMPLNHMHMHNAHACLYN